MHNAVFQSLNIDGIYLPFEVRPNRLEIALKSLVALGFGGINVTIPHKQTCMKYLDKVDKKTELIGAVNTIKIKRDTLIGYNTDGDGFLNSLKEKNIRLKGSKIFILGAGGASRAIAVSIIKADRIERIYIYDIDFLKAKNLVKDLNSIVDGIAIKVNKEYIEEIVNNVDILINATFVGLKKGEVPLDVKFINNNLRLVYDLIYNPPKTRLLQIAEDKDINIMNGLEMLIHQGIASFQIWTSNKPPVAIMRDAILSQVK